MIMRGSEPTLSGGVRYCVGFEGDQAGLPRVCCRWKQIPLKSTYE